MTHARNLTKTGSLKGRQAANAHRRFRVEQRARDLTPIVGELLAAGVRTVEGLADGLNARGFHAAKGGPWNEASLKGLMRRIDGNPSLDEALILIRRELLRTGGHRERNAQICRDRRAGRTFTSLGEEHGLHRERITKLCRLAEHPSLADGWKPQDSPCSDIDLRAYLEQLLTETGPGRIDHRPKYGKEPQPARRRERRANQSARSHVEH